MISVSDDNRVEIDGDANAILNQFATLVGTLMDVLTRTLDDKEGNASDVLSRVFEYGCTECVHTNVVVHEEITKY